MTEFDTERPAHDPDDPRGGGGTGGGPGTEAQDTWKKHLAGKEAKGEDTPEADDRSEPGAEDDEQPER
jgi:hypothetical protein